MSDQRNQLSDLWLVLSGFQWVNWPIGKIFSSKLKTLSFEDKTAIKQTNWVALNFMTWRGWIQTGFLFGTKWQKCCDDMTTHFWRTNRVDSQAGKLPWGTVFISSAQDVMCCVPLVVSSTLSVLNSSTCWKCATSSQFGSVRQLKLFGSCEPTIQFSCRTLTGELTFLAVSSFIHFSYLSCTQIS